MYNCRLARLAGAFENHIDLVLCIDGSDKKDIKLYTLDPFHLQKGQQGFEILPVNVQPRSAKKDICRHGTQKLPKTLIFIFITTK